MIGTTVADRYEIISQLGMGGMAKVYKAKDLNLGRDVALKVLLESVSGNPEFRERFRREARASAALSHPNIVQIYDFFEYNKDVFIVMELVDGRDLRDYLQERGRLSLDEAIRITLCVLSALEFAHSRGVVHRDISARNVMLSRDGTVKVADFGIARIVGERTLTQDGELIGSVQYISPEQASGGHATPAADIYSTGVLLYEMLTGELPFSSDNVVKLALMHVQTPAPKPSAICPEISEALDNIVLKAMAKNPAQRYRTAAEMTAALLSLRNAASPSSVPVAPAMPTATAAPRALQPNAPAYANQNGVAAPTSNASVGTPTSNVASTGNAAASAVTMGNATASAAALGTSAEHTMLRTRLPQNLIKMHEDSQTGPTRPLDDSSPVDTVDISNYEDEEYQDPEQGEYEQYYSEDGEPTEEGMGEEYDQAEVGAESGSVNKSLGLIIAVSLTILIAFVAGVTWVNLNSAPNVNVPSIVGQKLAQARETVKEAGLRLEVRSQKYQAGVKPGVVIHQEPDGGAQLVKDGVVWVDVSIGRELVAVPDLSGFTEERACEELDKDGLVYTIVPKESNAPVGTVFAQEPEAGQEIAVGNEVTVFISLGKGEDVIPDLSGMSLKSAADLMASLGGSVKVRSQKDDPKATDGTILSQEPTSGKAMQRGTVVYVVVCHRSGTKKVAPSLIGKSVAEAKAEAVGLGLDLVVEGDTGDNARVLTQKTEPGAVLNGNRLVVSASAQVPVPDVCTQTYEQAVNNLQNAGLKLGKVSAAAGQNDNIVIEQYPGAGQVVSLGSSIDLTVTKAVETESNSSADEGGETVNINAVPLREPEPSPVASGHDEASSNSVGNNHGGSSSDVNIELPGDLP